MFHNSANIYIYIYIYIFFFFLLLHGLALSLFKKSDYSLQLPSAHCLNLLNQDKFLICAKTISFSHGPFSEKCLIYNAF